MKVIASLLAFLMLGFVQAQDKVEDSISTQYELLLDRIDPTTPGLEEVANSSDPELAVNHLLEYLKDRAHVKHPLDRSEKKKQPRHFASAGDLKIADDALQHIFVGQPAYPPHFCGDDINWNTRPVPDMEWVWQLNRMTFWEAMGKAYWQTNDEKYVREWCLQLVDWVKKNPRDEEHKHAWRSIEAGIRGNRWTRLFQYFIDSPSFTPEVLAYYLNSLHEHASFLMTRYSTGSNWSLMEAEGMAFIAITFPEFKDAKMWREEAFRRLNNEIEKQVNADGHQRELAMGYHVGSIRWFMRTYQLAAMNGLEDSFPDTYLSSIEKMCEVPMKLAFPDGSTTQFGDSWSGKPGHYAEFFAEWSRIFDRSDFHFMATQGEEGTPPEQTAFAYPSSGLYSLRSGWDAEDIGLVLKCGQDGGGHCQPDNGTFELYAGGRHLMPDAGSYIYSGNPEGRAWFRQTSVHQTLTLNGNNSNYDPRLLLWKPGKEQDVLVAENGSYPDLTHRRAVIFVDKKYFVIVDEAYGDAVGDVDIHFQLAPGAAMFNYQKLTGRTDFREGWNVLVKGQDQVGLKLEQEEGQVSFVYTKKEPRPAFRYRLQKSKTEKRLRFVTVVYPYPKIVPEVEIHKVSTSGKNGSKVSVDLVLNGEKERISYQMD